MNTRPQQRALRANGDVLRTDELPGDLPVHDGQHFGDLIQSDKIIVYLDNILIFSDDLEEHHNTTMEVLRRLRKHKLMLKAEKCKFDQTTIDFLGVVVGNGQVSMDPEKTKAVREWRTPRNLKESHSFMQFCNYYRTFIPNFAAVTVPLNDLTCKDTPFVWGDCQTSSFRCPQAGHSRQCRPHATSPRSQV